MFIAIQDGEYRLIMCRCNFSFVHCSFFTEMVFDK